MTILIRGALVEYGSNFLGPLPNIVVFQFNPEELSRTINLPPAPSTATPEQNCRQREQDTVSGPPTESIQVNAHFSAADDLGKGGSVSAVPRVFGIGPQLAAIEKMVYPNTGFISEAIGAVVDVVGSALNTGGAQQEVPPERSPRILFIWGPSRILPVKIKSLSITEQKFDFLLNPVQAQVQLTLDVKSPSRSEDPVGYGALKITSTVKEVQASANLVKAVELAADIISF